MPAITRAGVEGRWRSVSDTSETRTKLQRERNRRLQKSNPCEHEIKSQHQIQKQAPEGIEMGVEKMFLEVPLSIRKRNYYWKG
jgi:hypothetical protein